MTKRLHFKDQSPSVAKKSTVEEKEKSKVVYNTTDFELMGTVRFGVDGDNIKPTVIHTAHTCQKVKILCSKSINNNFFFKFKLKKKLKRSGAKLS